MTMTMTTILVALQAATTATVAPPAILAGAPPAPAAAAPVGIPVGVKVPASALPRPDRAHVLAAVTAEWRRYDLHGAGRLGPLEFATWVMRANGAAVAPAGVKGAAGVRPVSAMNATARAFARADADHDGRVTPDEMTDFLMR